MKLVSISKPTKDGGISDRQNAPLVNLVQFYWLKVWGKRLGNDRLIRVTGWRSAIIGRGSSRHRITFIIFGKY